MGGAVVSRLVIRLSNTTYITLYRGAEVGHPNFVTMLTSLLQVMQIMTVVVGIFIHYFIPHLRKSMPWLWFLNPCLKSKEHHIFEVQSKLRCSFSNE